MPKLKGFKNPTRIEYKAINVGALEEMFKEGEVDFTNRKHPVKLLGTGEVTGPHTRFQGGLGLPCVCDDPVDRVGQ